MRDSIESLDVSGCLGCLAILLGLLLAIGGSLFLANLIFRVIQPMLPTDPGSIALQLIIAANIFNLFEKLLKALAERD